jgi:pimeloyl-ACP methyl ester carboxylesterase
MTADIVRSDVRLESSDGIGLALREVTVPDIVDTRVPVLLMHGTRIPGLSEYDLDVPGGSFAADLALRGHRVGILDARGFGRSDRPAEMKAPPQPGRALYRTLELTRDVDAAVDFLSRSSGHERVAAFGWGVGGTCVMAHAALYPEKISHLMLYNMVYGASAEHPRFRIGSIWDDPARPGRFNDQRFGNYTYNEVGMLGADWARQIPIEDKDAWRDPAMLAAFEQALIDGDPTACERTPPTYRSPNGMLEDLFLMATGHILIHASQVQAKVMIIRPEFDTLSRKDDMDGLVADLVHAEEVDLWEPKGTTHYLLFDRPQHGRDALLARMDNFLN